MEEEGRAHAAAAREAAAYLQTQGGFQRLAKLFAQKIRSLDRIGGTVTLTHPTREEKELLSALFRRDFSRRQSLTVSIEKFQQSLQETRFNGVKLLDLLKAYTGEEVVSRRAEASLYQQEKELFFQELWEMYPGQHCRRWLHNIIDKGPGSRGIHAAYDRNKDKLKLQLTNVLKAVSELSPAVAQQEGNLSPEVIYRRLPLFAARITGDPHGFDPDTEQGRFLLSVLSFLNPPTEDTTGLTAEGITELLQHFGLVRDDLLNFVSCCGLIAQDKYGQDVQWLQQAWGEGAVVNLPLREVLKFATVIPALKLPSAANPKVFVVENSGVFSELVDIIGPRNKALGLPPIISANGQFKLATLLLLDLLCKSGVEIYYSGDFDPEGLQMAQRLGMRYPKGFQLWRYSREDYVNSNPAVPLNARRLNKLDRVTWPMLQPVRESMLELKLAGYQESILPMLMEDLIKLLFLHL